MATIGDLANLSDSEPDMCDECDHPRHHDTDCGEPVGYDHLSGFHECGCPGLPTPAEALERAASVLDDLALTLMATSDDNPEGNRLTAAIVTKCADIVRQVQ